MKQDHQPGPGPDTPIEHIVVLMLENRSFDHMLGTLPGVDGILDAHGRVKPECANTVRLDSGEERIYRSAVPAKPVYVTAYGEGPSHSFPSATSQLFGHQTVKNDAGEDITPYEAGMTADMSGFADGYYYTVAHGRGDHPPDEDARQAATAEVMAVFDAKALPALHGLARAYRVCDRWFSSVPGPTEPNRLFTMAGTSTGLTYNPWKHDILKADVPTIYDRLDAAGRSWASYGFDLFDTDNFAVLKDRDEAHLQMDRFYRDAAGGALPFYSFLCPRYSIDGDAQPSSQHAPYDVRYGEKLIADVYAALRASPCWTKTLFIVVYDEHGGYFDHVVPPSAPAPGDQDSPNDFMRNESGASYLTEPKYTFDFTHLGCRVPAVLVSPWLDPGVDSTVYDHTSILKTIEELIGAEPLTARDAAATSLVPLLKARRTPRTDCPKTVPLPPMPPARPDAADDPPPDIVQEKVSRSTVHLEGHADTGKRVDHAFDSHHALRAYVARRRQFDRWHVAGEHASGTVQVYRDGAGKVRWRLKDGDDIIARGTDPAATHAAAEADWTATVSGLQRRAGVETYVDQAGAHRWRLVANGDIVAVGTDGHASPEALHGALNRAEYLATHQTFPAAVARALPADGVVLQGPAGEHVDWWFLYKLPSNQAAGDDETTGNECLYFGPGSTALAMAPEGLEKPGNPLNRMVAAFEEQTRWGVIYYDDEYVAPVGEPAGTQGTTSDGDRFGHTKGIIAWDLQTDTAVWIVHSIPRYAVPGDATFPDNELGNGQSLLAIQLAGLEDARTLAGIMAVQQQPQVYWYRLPAGTADDDPLALLTGELDTRAHTTDPKVWRFASHGGAAFTLMAKNRHWNEDQAEDTSDFWEDLVYPTLGAELAVETWMRNPTADVEGTADGVDDVRTIDLSPIGVDIGWRYTKDHAKWAASVDGDWVVVADINDTEAQRDRSGGGVGFECAVLNDALLSIIGTTRDDPEAG